MDFRGTVIEESLEDSSVLKGLNILESKVKPVTDNERTPWLKQWTLHTVEIPERRADVIAKKLSHAIDSAHTSSWYVDFKNQLTHFIIFRHKVFHIDRSQIQQYEVAKKYGVQLGIPEYQLDFSADTSP